MKEVIGNTVAAIFVAAIAISGVWWFVSFVNSAAKTKAGRIFAAVAMIGGMVFVYEFRDWWGKQHPETEHMMFPFFSHDASKHPDR